jgi:hypothetical protein
MPYSGYGTETSNLILISLRAGFNFRLRHKNRESFAMIRCAHDLISLKSKGTYFQHLLRYLI